MGTISLGFTRGDQHERHRPARAPRPVLGDAPSGPTVRRALDLAGTAAALDKVACARARARAQAWKLIEATPAGFPWLQIAGKTLTGWMVIDMDATLVTASSDKEGAAPTWKKGYGFHPLGAWLANTRECLAMQLRPGNAGSNTFTDRKEVLVAALRQVPARFRNRILVRVDVAGASHDLVSHLLSLSSPRKTAALFTCGWMITGADEAAIMQVPQDAWKPGIGQDGETQEDKDVAEITHLISRAGKWPGGLRWIARRVKPSRRQMPNLTAWEKKTGWRYSIICTNIPDNGITGIPGSHHPQYIDVAHREHAVVETGRLDPPPRLPRRRRAARRRLGHAPLPDLAHPARLARHARQRTLAISPRLALEGRVPHLLAATLRPARTRLTSNEQPKRQEGGSPGAVGAGAHPGTLGTPRTPAPQGRPDMKTKNGCQHNQ